MEHSSDEFGLNLADFGLQDFVSDAAENPSMFDGQSQNHDKARNAAQRSMMHTPNPQMMGNTNGYYSFAHDAGSQSQSGPGNANANMNVNGNGNGNGNGNENGNSALPSLSNLSIEQLNMLLNVGLSQPNVTIPNEGQAGSGSGSTLATAENLKEQIAQQIKLQQLQQLQNHILQQQIQLLTAGAKGITNKDVQQLLTPGWDTAASMTYAWQQSHAHPAALSQLDHPSTSSTDSISSTASSADLRSVTGSTQVSPNILPPGMFPPSHPGSGRMHTTPAHASHFNPNLTMSAPASLAFNISGNSQSPPSEFLTPLTSPVFPPVASQHRRGSIAKRPADVFDPEADGSSAGGPRKRPAHSHSYGNLNMASMGMTTVSPALLSNIPKHRKSSLSTGGAAGGTAMDTPSPIDLSMPPPTGPGSNFLHHPPHSHPHSNMTMSNAGGDTDVQMSLAVQGSDRQLMPPPQSTPTSTTVTNNSNNTPNSSSDMLPATPSLLMNMGTMPHSTGLIPPMMESPNGNGVERNTHQSQPHSQHSQASQDQPASSALSSPQRKTKITSRTRGMSTSIVQPAPSSSSSSTTVAASKTRRAAAATAAARNASASTGSSRTTGFGPKVKSTHKDAEQKRRDSLKTSFDELRLLLPPIPLSSSSGGNGPLGPLAGLGLTGDDSDETPLPGAMPPRGPPRGDGDGPNKGVSKLVLLRCGNEFIRDLVGRVNRRDEEIVRLRSEVRRLRDAFGALNLGMGMGGMGVGVVLEEGVDIEKDLEKEDEWFREERRKARKKKLEEEQEEEE